MMTKKTAVFACAAALFTSAVFAQDNTWPPGFEVPEGATERQAGMIEWANKYEFGETSKKDYSEKVAPSIPTTPIVKPARPRRLLLHHNPQGYRHLSETLLRRAVEEMCGKTGACEVTVSHDVETLAPESLARYDAIFFSISTAYPEERLPAVLEFVRNGGGLVAVHSSATAFKDKEFFALIGGEFRNHPFGGREVTLRNETPDSPLTAMFPASFKITDEIFHFSGPYSRDRMTVLLSIDYENSPEAIAITEAKMKGWDKPWLPPGLREDNDYAASWVRTEGKGRVFFTSLGHERDTIGDPRYLKHVLAAIQYVCGDIPEIGKKDTGAEDEIGVKQ